MNKKYRIVAYPTLNSYETIVEASDKEVAKEIGEEEANQNCSYIVTDNNVEEMES